MSDKLWRTLVRVTGIQKDGVWLCVPGWNSEISVLRDTAIIIKDVEGVFLPGQRFFAKVNLGAESADDLRFTDFEFSEQLEDL